MGEEKKLNLDLEDFNLEEGEKYFKKPITLSNDFSKIPINQVNQQCTYNEDYDDYEDYMLFCYYNQGAFSSKSRNSRDDDFWKSQKSENCELDGLLDSMYWGTKHE